MSNPTRYEIRTLKDIFELPTMEAMQTCLAEMAPMMIKARAANDEILAIMKAQGIEASSAVQWPDAVEWIDDGKHEISLGFRHDGETLMTVKTTTNP
jgi:hypothetical protein